MDTEPVPAGHLEALEAANPVRPSTKVLHATQEQLEQRRFLDERGVPQVRFTVVADGESLLSNASPVGFPLLLKTRRAGDDGKGQARAARTEELGGARKAIQQKPAVLEWFVDLEKEISVLLPRDLDGNMRFHPIAETCIEIMLCGRAECRCGFRRFSSAEAMRAPRASASALDVEGMMSVELFVTRDKLRARWPDLFGDAWLPDDQEPGLVRKALLAGELERGAAPDSQGYSIDT